MPIGRKEKVVRNVFRWLLFGTIFTLSLPGIYLGNNGKVAGLTYLYSPPKIVNNTKNLFVMLLELGTNKETVQHFALFEHISGFTLFRVKEFDEITRQFSAHPNAFIKPVAFLHFKSVDEAVKNCQAVADGIVSDLLLFFLRTNLPSQDCRLGVCDSKLGKGILTCGLGFDCIWHAGVLEVLRIIRHNFTRLTRSLITQPGATSLLSIANFKKTISSGSDEIISGRVAESRARLIVALSRAQVQLNLSKHLADSAIVKILAIIDDLDTHLVRSTSRLRACYNLHFPEVCHSNFDKTVYLKDIQLLKLISQCPMRTMIESICDNGLLTSCFDNPDLAKRVALAAQDSIGADLNEEDCENLKNFADRLLKLIQTRQSHIHSLSQRISQLCPNLYTLLNNCLNIPVEHSRFELKAGNSLSPCIIAARLIANAGSFSRLASMPSTRILSLGASKSLFRKSGAVAATSTGLLSSVSKSFSARLSHSVNQSHLAMKLQSANRIQPDLVRRRAARLLAAKAALASRADYFRYHNPTQSATRSHDDDDERLKTGAYGDHLSKEVRNSLRVWAECNGVHSGRTLEQIKTQRERRKRYRKKKRKAWLRRKLSKGVTNPTISDIQNSTDSKPKPVDSSESVTDSAIDIPMDVDIDESNKKSLQTAKKSPAKVVVQTKRLLRSQNRQIK